MPSAGRLGARRLTALGILTALAAASLVGVTAAPAAAGSLSISNPTPIMIPDSGDASPSPAAVTVSGLSGVTSKVTVQLTGFTHDYLQDVGVLLVAPSGTGVILLSDIAQSHDASDNTIVFDDEATGGVPNADLVDGVYRPSNDGIAIEPDVWGGAPAGPYGGALSDLIGEDPNGSWRLFVTDESAGSGGEITGGWTLNVESAVPAISAGGPYTVPEGSGVELAASFNLSGATYAWDVDGDGLYDDATGANPTVAAATLAAIGLGDGPDSSNVRVRASVGDVVETSSATMLTVTNVAPTATLTNGGPVEVGNTTDVTFSGQADPGSADPVAGLRYAYDFDDDGDWEVGDGTYAGGSTSSSATVPAAVLDEGGPHDVAARVVDKDGGFADYTTAILVKTPPVARAGDDQVVAAGQYVTLDGTASGDSDGDSLTYAWTQISGPPVTLGGANTASPTFSAPTDPTNLSFRLTVSDGQSGVIDDMAVRVNGAPVADAGSDLVVSAGDAVELDGSGSSDADGEGLTYAWTHHAGESVTLDDPDTATPSFTAPAAGSTVTWELTVSDGFQSDDDLVTVTVNTPPAAEAGDDQRVIAGETVHLDASASSDADADSLTYVWTQATGDPVTLHDATTATPYFTAPVAGSVMTFELSVYDGLVETDSDEVVITVNQVPTADAGDDQVVQDGATVGLDGSESTDDDSDTLTYSWDQLSGPAVVVSGAGTAAPSFTAPTGPATLTFRLVTNDGVQTDLDVVSIRVNGRPTADAGGDLVVNAGDEVHLDGTGSSDPDGDTLTYAWVETTGVGVTVTGANTASPSFSAPAAGSVLTFDLTVSDGARTHTAEVTVIVNRAPEADAGSDQLVNHDDSVTLDGSESSDPDGDTLTYAWEQIGGGTVVALDGANTATPAFTAPFGPDVLVFEMTVHDGHGGSDSDRITVTVNAPPVADAGDDRSAAAEEDVHLDGSGSYDPDGDTLTYSWEQTDGPTVTLVGAATATPSFVAPAGSAPLTFEVTVDDGNGESDTDSVSISRNRAPTADAGDDRGAHAGSGVTLDGSGSSDPDGDALTYSWAQTGGPTVTLGGATTAHPSFTAPGAGSTLTFELTVDDGLVTDTDTVSVTVNPAPSGDTTKPAATVTSAAGALVNGPFVVDIGFSEAVTGLTAGDLETTNASVSGLTGSGASYQVTVTPLADGAVTVTVLAGAAADAAGNASTTSNPLTRTYDGTAPTVAVDFETDLADELVFAVTASEPVGELAAGDVEITGDTGADEVVVARMGDRAFEVRVSGMTTTGTVGVRLAPGVFQDAAGNGSAVAEAATTWTAPALPVLALGTEHSCIRSVGARLAFTVESEAPFTLDVSSSPAARLDGTVLTLLPRGAGVEAVTVTVTNAAGSTTMRVRVVSGTAGDDRLRGKAGTDVLIGRAGHDRLSGGPGDDLLCGGRGEDVLRGGAGTNWLF
ncbi:PKD domain-containing protein [Nocardioides sp. SR21]|uniref:PKD domain-containing protein n=1 Tax=Nocardioides sp. SR21 TaxID=2919501 RepID=UPI001FAACF7A|nr:PKD domain-containing protein [Nocardioides sp. SR21]